MTTNDNDRYNEWQRVTKSGRTSDNGWQHVITNDNGWQRVSTSDNE